MFKNLRDNKGQGIAVQYVLIFFIVIAFVSSMSVYVRRVLQGRIQDAGDFLVKQVSAIHSNAEMNFLGNLVREYEPYYIKTDSFRSASSDTLRREDVFAPAANVGVFRLDVDDRTHVKSISEQKRPIDALQDQGIEPPSVRTGE